MVDARRGTRQVTRTAEHAAKRDAVISAAIKARKFSENHRAHYAELYAADPAATERLIGMIQAPPDLSGQEPARPPGTGLIPNRGRRLR